MNYLRSVCLAFSFAMIGGGIFRLLAPQNYMKQTMRMITGLFIICCIVIPFTRLYLFVSTKDSDEIFNHSDSFLSMQETPEVEESVLLNFVRKDAEKTFEQAIGELLKENSMDFATISVQLSAQSQELDHARVTVFLTPQQLSQKDAIFTLIRTKYSKNVEVIAKLEEEDEAVA